jgi:hypothetical protein
MIILDPMPKKVRINQLLLNNMRTAIDIRIFLTAQWGLTFVLESLAHLYLLHRDPGSNSKPIEHHPYFELNLQLAQPVMVRIQRLLPKCLPSNSSPAKRSRITIFPENIHNCFQNRCVLLCGALQGSVHRVSHHCGIQSQSVAEKLS